MLMISKIGHGLLNAANLVVLVSDLLEILNGVGAYLWGMIG